jgi:hypothetical protein
MGLSQKYETPQFMGLESTSNGQLRTNDCFISKADVAVRLGKTARTVEQ